MEIGPIWRAMMRNKTGAILHLHHAGTDTRNGAPHRYR